MTEADKKQVEVDKLADVLATEKVGTKTEKPIKEEAVIEEKLIKEEVVVEEEPIKEETVIEEKPIKEEAVTEERKGAAITERKGIVSDPSVLPDSNDPDEARKQVCFFFASAVSGSHRLMCLFLPGRILL